MGYNLRSGSAKQTVAAGRDEVNHPVLQTVSRPARVVKPLLLKQPKRPCYAKWSAERINARIDVLKSQMALFEEAKHHKVKGSQRDNSLVVEFMLRQGLDRTTIGVLIHEAAKYTTANAV